jgi:phosphate ABC transporter permease protein PstC
LVIGAATLLFISLFILYEAYPTFVYENTLLSFLIDDPWLPLGSPPKFGILHAWLSTLLITVVCLSIAVPTGYLIGLFISEIAPNAVRSVVQPCLDLLAGIPSVVYGFFGYVTLVPWFEANFGMATGESIMVAALILAAMCLPFIASTSAEAYFSVPAEMREASLSQGVTRWHTVRRVILVQAAPGMFAAAALGFARSVGETLAVLMLAGNSTAVPTSLLDRGQPLTALIATELGEAGVGSPKYHSLFAAGFILILIVIAINGIIWSWKKRVLRRA